MVYFHQKQLFYKFDELIFIFKMQYNIKNLFFKEIFNNYDIINLTRKLILHYIFIFNNYVVKIYKNLTLI